MFVALRFFTVIFTGFHLVPLGCALGFLPLFSLHLDVIFLRDVLIIVVSNCI